MPHRAVELLRPSLVERIAFDPARDGQPCIRDTGILVSDVSFELGPERLSDQEVLSRHAELEQADLDAVRGYANSPIEFDALLDRVMGPDPRHDDIMAAYLFLPRIKLSYHEHPNMGVPMEARSSFEAAFADAARCRGMWLAAIGDLVLLDQLGTALDRTDRQVSPSSVSSVERALERFSDLVEPERATLYALRCALAHDFSLVNIPTTNNPSRRAQLLHAFALHNDAGRALIEFPNTPWDGDLRTANETYIHLGLLAELTANVRQRVYDCYDSGTLRLGLSPEETRRRYIFTHGASIEEWDDQRRADERARWRSPP